MSRELMKEIEKLDEKLGDEQAELTKDVIYGIQKLMKRVDDLALIDFTHLSKKEREAVIEKLDLFLERYKSYNKETQQESNKINEKAVEHLSGVVELLKAADKSSAELHKQVDELKEAQKKTNDHIGEVKDALIALRKAIPDVVKTEVKNPVTDITVKNPVKEVDIKKPNWYKALNAKQEITVPLAEVIAEAVKQILKVQIVNTSNPGQPVAVRLSDGKKFYEAITNVLSSSGGGGGGSSIFATGGIQHGNVTHDVKHAIVSASSNGDNELIASVSGKKIVVVSGLLMVSAAVTLTFKSDTVAITGPLPPAANAGFQIPFNPYGNFETAEGDALNLNLSTGVTVGGWLNYILV